ncbi:MAG: hypothetical protein AAGF89_10735 [Bacteroidota bacterium]
MRFFLSLSLSVLIFFACGDDTNEIAEAATVEGHWELARATRNNVETGTLEGLTFDFNADGSLYTNMMNNEAIGSYEWNEDEIITTGVKIPVTYTVRTLTDSTMVLRSKIQGYQFDFEMVRPYEDDAH